MTEPSPNEFALDPVALAQQLVRLPTVTPQSSEALDVLQSLLSAAGFCCSRFVFEGEGSPPVDNLYARYGSAAPHLAFAGHLDVVPAGDENAWSHPPFAGTIADGVLFGRGACDMKGAIAAFVAAAVSHVRKSANEPSPGSLSLILTGDEEGPAINGTKKLMAELARQGEKWDGCITGEPTNPQKIGEMIKIGRRGSLHGVLKIKGRQGHVGYPHLARSAAHDLIRILHGLMEWQIDSGNAEFQPSVFQVTALNVREIAANVIPANAHARFNIRFNNLHNADSLEKALRTQLSALAEGAEWHLTTRSGAEPFLTPSGSFLERTLRKACQTVAQTTPIVSTSGGTSDSRFIREFCPVLDFGLVGASMHQPDESARVEDILILTRIYDFVIRAFMKTKHCELVS